MTVSASRAGTVPPKELPLEPIREGMVKICGLRRPEDARAATLAGADLLGFIFAPAKRQVTADVARQCIEAARLADRDQRRPKAVGVFVDASPEEMNAAADAADLDLLQLHGNEAPEILTRLQRPVIKALRPLPEMLVGDVVAVIANYADVTNAPVAYLIDGFSPTAHGGAGIRADWTLTREIAARHIVILAGGLDPTNVCDAIDACGPAAVDVSSGVERNGVKDSALIGAFVHAAKQAFFALQR